MRGQLAIDEKIFELIARAGARLVTIACISLAALFLTAADVFLGGRQILPIRPVFLFGGFIMILCVFLCAHVHKEARFATAFVLLLLARWRLLLLSICLFASVTLAMSVGPGADWSESGINIFLPAFSSLSFASGVILVMLWPEQRSQRVLLWLSLLGAIGSIFIDLILPGSFSKLVQRAAGFAENSNFGAAV